MEIVELLYSFFSGALKSIEVKIAGATILAGVAVESAVSSSNIALHGDWYYTVEAIGTVGKAVVYSSGAVAFLWKGFGGAIDWWNKRNERGADR